MSKVSVAVKDGLWDEAKSSRLMETALQAAHSTNCGTGTATAEMEEFKGILVARMREVLSEVCLFAYIELSHLPSLLIGSIGPQFISQSQCDGCKGIIFRGVQ